MKYIIIEQAEDNEALITRVTKKGMENYESLTGGNFIILSEEAYNNLCIMGCGG